jgi:hypothetical protein
VKTEAHRCRSLSLLMSFYSSVSPAAEDTLWLVTIQGKRNRSAYRSDFGSDCVGNCYAEWRNLESNFPANPEHCRRVPPHEERIVSGKFGMLWNDRQPLLLLEDLLTISIPTRIEFAFVLIYPLLTATRFASSPD